MDTANPLLAAAFRRADLAAMAVRSIIVTPDSLVLHVGDRIDPWRDLRIEARDSAGVRVAGFAPLLRVEDYAVFRPESDGWYAITVGRTRLLIEAIVRDPALRLSSTPRTSVAIVVVR